MPRILVIGHPLAAPENREPFLDLKSVEVALCIPKNWKSPSLRAAYSPTSAMEVPSVYSRSVVLPGRNSFFLWRNLATVFSSANPDAVYCWEEPWCLSTFQVLRHCLRRRIPFCFYSAENRPKSLPLGFQQLRSYVYQRSAAAIAITTEAQVQLRQSGFRGPVYLVPLWIRPSPAALPRPDSSSAHRNLFYLGRLIPLKRVDQLITAMKQLAGFQLHILGDGPERVSLELLARQLGLVDRVTFHGLVPNDRLSTILQAGGLMVIPTGENASQAEQFGKAALESLVMNVPVLASHTGNYPAFAEIFPALRTTIFSTPEELARDVRQAFDNYPSRQTLEECRSKTLELYGTHAASRRLETAFLSLLTTST